MVQHNFRSFFVGQDHGTINLSPLYLSEFEPVGLKGINDKIQTAVQGTFRFICLEKLQGSGLVGYPIHHKSFIE